VENPILVWNYFMFNDSSRWHKLGHGTLTSYAHINYGKWNKISHIRKFSYEQVRNYYLAFIEINQIIGKKLHVPSDSAVFKSGYKVEKIDFKTKYVIFSKIDSPV